MTMVPLQEEVFCWYEKKVGVTIALDEYKISPLPTSGVVGEGLEWDTDRPGSIYDYYDFEMDSEDPRICQAYCYQDPICQAWVYYPPDNWRSIKPWCWLKDRIPPSQPSNKKYVAGIKY